jgi:hypothetical protein
VGFFVTLRKTKEADHFIHVDELVSTTSDAKERQMEDEKTFFGIPASEVTWRDIFAWAQLEAAARKMLSEK